MHYIRIQWAEIKIRQQRILEKKNQETARLRQREGEPMNMKPPPPPPPDKWMWEIASIYKWPPPPQPSQEEEQKIAVRREKALDLINKQWTEIKEKIRKMLEMEKIIISRNIAEAQGKIKTKLAVDKNYQQCMKLQ